MKVVNTHGIITIDGQIDHAEPVLENQVRRLK